MKKTKEIHELMVERKNIENMIVNSKLWSAPFQANSQMMMDNGAFSSTTGTQKSTDGSNAFTSNVFKGKL